MLKKGDNIRFLNAIGGGIIKSIDEKKGIVYVEDADGFETPALITEVVVVPKVNADTNVPFREIFVKKEEENLTENKSSISENKTTNADFIEIVETEYGDSPNFVLAFFAKNLKELQISDFECFLINDSNYYIFYSISAKENNQFSPISSGILEPNLQENIAKIANNELNNWQNVNIQIIAYKKNKTFSAQKALDIDLKIEPLKFFKLHSFAENDYSDEPAMIYNLTELKENQQLTTINPEDIKHAIFSKKIEQKPAAKPHRRKAEIVEVDLHINALLDTTAGLSNADMLEYQLNKFNETLENYKDKRGQRIVFIHGKGEGVLRVEIEKLLKTRYKTYYFQDASFQKYGFGATMVMIR